jgi:hypothetical protein
VDEGAEIAIAIAMLSAAIRINSTLNTTEFTFIALTSRLNCVLAWDMALKMRGGTRLAWKKGGRFIGV